MNQIMHGGPLEAGPPLASFPGLPCEREAYFSLSRKAWERFSLAWKADPDTPSVASVVADLILATDPVFPYNLCREDFRQPGVL